ncbi:MAG TPA: DNA primase [Candidatus Caccovicinus merdipullorum]|mgnify:FL=1|uniref:DNA primase n=1 Tax=Candidatus Caccovicinus merdipullorum TaxID=2840724 RepID=A0A9D1GL85_9FIRM|nr:DNA primase [Candidatus Caccovicinus merdipullorum]
MRYPEEVIEEVRMRNDIVDVISGYVKLQRKGSNYFGLCPFHNEKSPSFSVSPGKQMYYCFGCGAGGNVITFIMEYENYSFTEALNLLAERAGVALPKQEYSPEARAQEDLKKNLLEINKLAANYFYYQLKHPQGKAGYDYLKNRQLTDDTIRHFGLGFANKTSDDLYRFLKDKGYPDSLLKETGLVTIEERGAHDKFWNRVMFPILDVNNRVIGFGGRVMGDGTPKYLNSPETRLFDKSRNLFGLNYARTSREKYMLICEGYMDVIAMHQAGFTNSVASLGTAFTSQHASLLKRYTDQVVLTYDSDGAGVKAALRAIPILKDVGMSVKVLNMRPYKDPDEFIKNLGADAFRQRIEEAKNSFLFEIDVLKGQYDMEDPEQKTRFYQETARKLLEFPEALERDNYIQAVSREHFIPYEDLKRLVNQLGSRLGSGPAAAGRRDYEEKSQAKRSPKKDKDEGNRQSQRLLLTWLIENPGLFDRIQGIITADDFVEPLYHQVAQMVFQGHEENALNPAGILNHFINDEEQYREVAALFNASLKESLSNEEQKKAFSETVMKVKKNSLDAASRHAGSIEELQRIIQAQAALRSLHISLDEGIN